MKTVLLIFLVIATGSFSLRLIKKPLKYMRLDSEDNISLDLCNHLNLRGVSQLKIRTAIEDQVSHISSFYPKDFIPAEYIPNSNSLSTVSTDRIIYLYTKSIHSKVTMFMMVESTSIRQRWKRVIPQVYPEGADKVQSQTNCETSLTLEEGGILVLCPLNIISTDAKVEPKVLLQFVYFANKQAFIPERAAAEGVQFEFGKRMKAFKSKEGILLFYKEGTTLRTDRLYFLKFFDGAPPLKYLTYSKSLEFNWTSKFEVIYSVNTPPSGITYRQISESDFLVYAKHISGEKGVYSVTFTDDALVIVPLEYTKLKGNSMNWFVDDKFTYSFIASKKSTPETILLHINHKDELGTVDFSIIDLKFRIPVLAPFKRIHIYRGKFATGFRLENEEGCATQWVMFDKKELNLGVGKIDDTWTDYIGPFPSVKSFFHYGNKMLMNNILGCPEIQFHAKKIVKTSGEKGIFGFNVSLASEKMGVAFNDVMTVTGIVLKDPLRFLKIEYKPLVFPTYNKISTKLPVDMNEIRGSNIEINHLSDGFIDLDDKSFTELDVSSLNTLYQQTSQINFKIIQKSLIVFSTMDIPAPDGNGAVAKRTIHLFDIKFDKNVMNTARLNDSPISFVGDIQTEIETAAFQIKKYLCIITEELNIFRKIYRIYFLYKPNYFLEVNEYLCPQTTCDFVLVDRKQGSVLDLYVGQKDQILVYEIDAEKSGKINRLLFTINAEFLYLPEFCPISIKFNFYQPELIVFLSKCTTSENPGKMILYFFDTRGLILDLSKTIQLPDIKAIEGSRFCQIQQEFMMKVSKGSQNQQLMGIRSSSFNSNMINYRTPEDIQLTQSNSKFQCYQSLEAAAVLYTEKDGLGKTKTHLLIYKSGTIHNGDRRFLADYIFPIEKWQMFFQDFQDDLILFVTDFHRQLKAYKLLFEQPSLVLKSEKSVEGRADIFLKFDNLYETRSICHPLFLINPKDRPVLSKKAKFKFDQEISIDNFIKFDGPTYGTFVMKPPETASKIHYKEHVTEKEYKMDLNVMFYLDSISLDERKQLLLGYVYYELLTQTLVYLFDDDLNFQGSFSLPYNCKEITHSFFEDEIFVIGKCSGESSSSKLNAYLIDPKNEFSITLVGSYDYGDFTKLQIYKGNSNDFMIQIQYEDEGFVDFIKFILFKGDNGQTYNLVKGLWSIPNSFGVTTISYDQNTIIVIFVDDFRTEELNYIVIKKSEFFKFTEIKTLPFDNPLYIDKMHCAKMEIEEDTKASCILIGKGIYFMELIMNYDDTKRSLDIWIANRYKKYLDYEPKIINQNKEFLIMQSFSESQHDHRSILIYRRDLEKPEEDRKKYFKNEFLELYYTIPEWNYCRGCEQLIEMKVLKGGSIVILSKYSGRIWVKFKLHKRVIRVDSSLKREEYKDYGLMFVLPTGNADFGHDHTLDKLMNPEDTNRNKGLTINYYGLVSLILGLFVVMMVAWKVDVTRRRDISRRMWKVKKELVESEIFDDYAIPNLKQEGMSSPINYRKGSDGMMFSISKEGTSNGTLVNL